MTLDVMKESFMTSPTLPNVATPRGRDLAETLTSGAVNDSFMTSRSGLDRAALSWPSCTLPRRVLNTDLALDAVECQRSGR